MEEEGAVVSCIVAVLVERRLTVPGGEDWRGSVPGWSVLRPDTPIYQLSTPSQPSPCLITSVNQARPRYQWSLSGVATLKADILQR